VPAPGISVNVVGVTRTPPSRPPLDRDLRPDPLWRVEVVEALPSTNAAVVERARRDEPEGLVLVAEHQTAGRGRLDRAWETPARAALTFSALLRPRVPDRRWPWLPLLAGVAVCEGVAAAGGPRCELKWPNDVMYGDHKLAGILAERVDTRAGAALVVGIGLNVTSQREELPVPTATSLLLAGMPAPDRSRLLVAILDALADHYRAWQEAGGDASAGLAADYTRVCRTVGSEVEVHLPDGRTLRGRAVGVDDDGGLVVDSGGTRVSLSAGDVVHVRPGAAP
jgi:BirA family transcriptional regulator, biotin operon repressor / biotin---[acetyl-CoA-carboxylase] ligase